MPAETTDLFNVASNAVAAASANAASASSTNPPPPGNYRTWGERKWIRKSISHRTETAVNRKKNTAGDLTLSTEDEGAAIKRQVYSMVVECQVRAATIAASAWVTFVENKHFPDSEIWVGDTDGNGKVIDVSAKFWRMRGTNSIESEGVANVTANIELILNFDTYEGWELDDDT
jgi:hypothetical protein